MRWVGLAFLPGVCCTLMLLAYMGYVGQAYFAMYPLVFLGAVFFVLSLRRSRAWYRHGHCRNCGYCLTGNTSGVCPECGERI